MGIKNKTNGPYRLIIVLALGFAETNVSVIAQAIRLYNPRALLQNSSLWSKFRLQLQLQISKLYCHNWYHSTREHSLQLKLLTNDELKDKIKLYKT